jgi:hypothetical protein
LDHGGTSLDDDNLVNLLDQTPEPLLAPRCASLMPKNDIVNRGLSTVDGQATSRVRRVRVEEVDENKEWKRMARIHLYHAFIGFKQSSILSNFKCSVRHPKRSIWYV